MTSLRKCLRSRLAVVPVFHGRREVGQMEGLGLEVHLDLKNLEVKATLRVVKV